MNKVFKNKSEERFYNNFNKQVEQYTNEKSSKPQAIAIVARKMKLNPYRIINQFYPELQYEEDINDDDIQTEEGSFVFLRADPSKKQYEVININNKDAIVLRNVDNNEEITASETEITPVITENKMNKLDEAQYNISINDLETEDAATLSQMLDLANQAETNNGSVVSSDMQSDMAVNPEPMDVDTGMPMNMEEPSEDDIEFDEELPMDTDLGADETPSMDMEVDSYNEPETQMFEPKGIMPDLDTNSDSIGDMSMDDMMDSGMYDDTFDSEEIDEPEETTEDFDYDALMKEALDAAQNTKELNETEEMIPGDKFIEDNGQLEGEQEHYAEDITENEEPELSDDDFESEIAEALRLAGIQLNEEEFDDELSDENNDSIIDEATEVEPDMFDNEYDKTFVDGRRTLTFRDVYDAMSKIAPNFDYVDDKEINGVLNLVYQTNSHDYSIDDLKRIKQELNNKFDNAVTVKAVRSQYAPEQKKIYIGFVQTPEESDLDDEIAESLRLAGIQLNEEETNGPEVVTDETLYINKDKEEDKPEYKAVDTDTFGKDASEGMKKSMTFESTINLNKIKSIYETAKSMYAKKDSKEWLSLDRRYTEKLIREGVGFEKASKMLIEAKKGK